MEEPQLPRRGNDSGVPRYGPGKNADCAKRFSPPLQRRPVPMGVRSTFQAPASSNLLMAI